MRYQFGSTPRLVLCAGPIASPDLNRPRKQVCCHGSSGESARDGEFESRSLGVSGLLRIVMGCSEEIDFPETSPASASLRLTSLAPKLDPETEKLAIRADAPGPGRKEDTPAGFGVRKRLRADRKRLVGHLHHLNGEHHRDINARINGACGVVSFEEATVDQLRRSIELLNAEIKRQAADRLTLDKQGLSREDRSGRSREEKRARSEATTLKEKQRPKAQEESLGKEATLMSGKHSGQWAPGGSEEIGHFGCAAGGGRIVRVAYAGKGSRPKVATVHCPVCGVRHEIGIAWRSSTPRDEGREADVVLEAKEGISSPSDAGIGAR